ncbi:glycosyltransferase [Tateyamaria omphalii]|uniref:Glycosyltransferase 2-like domain-containing protein n=1 Tax=Tateyamaria omphalii TaxID=299262 RepID=A0A1P8N244_9RHOB|nr:glycosyltransferase [Tateyamaria omphalii]APX14380.1 hypothetical protein BWR18_21190 [Tateyamaria omphalii]
MSRAALPVTIVLCTCNGATHLDAQLQSYLDQTHANWALWISDDGSDDATLDILHAFRAAHGDRHDIRLLERPGRAGRRGAARNFLTTLCHPDLPRTHVAVSDQDDVWRPDKLARALARMDAADPVTLYGAQSVHVDTDLQPIGGSRPPARAPGLCNALVQNVVSGHSTVLSPEALARVRQAGPVAVPHHDWWLYLLIAASGGQVVVDDAATLLYRQHRGNVMGAHRGRRAQLARLRQILDGTYGDWIGTNLAALGGAGVPLTGAARTALDLYRAAAPRRAGPARMALWRHLGAYRQSGLEQRLLMLAAALGRV